MSYCVVYLVINALYFPGMELRQMMIDEQILETALRRKLSHETVKIVTVTQNCLSEKGVNFLSDLFAISIVYATNSKKEKSKCSISMIMKIEPAVEGIRNLIREQKLFLTELSFLRDVLPRIKKAVRCQLGPDLFYGSENPPALLMEDLAARGFIMKNRQIGFSLEHCCFVMKQLAKFHAGSVLVLEENPELSRAFIDTGVVSTNCPKPYVRLMEVSVARIGDQIKQWADERCTLAGDKLIKLSKDIGSRCLDAYNCDPNEFCVLNHGDCWVNNMMFKENENGQPIDVLFVDYQMAVYASPVIDLLYFLNVCPEFDVKYDYDDHLLKIYLNTLKETMENIGCKRRPPTMEELLEAMHKRRIYAVFSGVVLYLRMMAGKEDTEDFMEVLNTRKGETRMDVFRNPDAVKLARKMIPIMNERGYLD